MGTTNQEGSTVNTVPSTPDTTTAPELVYPRTAGADDQPTTEPSSVETSDQEFWNELHREFPTAPSWAYDPPDWNDDIDAEGDLWGFPRIRRVWERTVGSNRSGNVGVLISREDTGVLLGDVITMRPGPQMIRVDSDGALTATGARLVASALLAAADLAEQEDNIATEHTAPTQDTPE